MLHFIFYASWFLGWGSVAANLLFRLRRGLSIVLLALLAWCFVAEGVVLVIKEHSLLLHAAALMATLHL